MSFRVNDKLLFKKYNNKIWNIVENFMRIDFKSKPTYSYDDKYLKTKVKTHAESITTNFIIKKCQSKKYHVNVYQ